MNAGDYSYASIFWMYSLMALFVAGAVFFLLKAIRSGAVRDDEAPKYRMLDDSLDRGSALDRENVTEVGNHGERS